MLTDGFNHVEMTTRDLIAQLAFWKEGFDVQTMLIDDEAPFRHAFVMLGPGVVIHLFELDESWTGPMPTTPMFRRGRLDHFAVAAAGEQALLDIRERVMALGACDGTITEFPGVPGFDQPVSLFVVDPDGGEMEVACMRTGELITDDMVVEFQPPVAAPA
jgi:catechol 2,3-dioxygenase-like lactoylglutathione lyase family enzyme